MRKFFLMSALCLAAALAFTGCKSSTPPEDLQNVPEALDDPSGNGGRFGSGSGNGGTGLDSDGGRGFGAGANGGAWGAGANEASVGGGSANGADADGWVPADPSGNRLGMPIIYFAYDSEQLIPREAEKLNDIAEFLGKNQALCLVIEGHCDQRGTDEYNRSLGERRANAIRAYLTERGVADNRMKTVSYGKDQPAVQGNDESAWRKNRRGVPVPMKVAR